MHYQIARGIIGLTLTLTLITCLVLSQAHAHGKAKPLVPTPASLKRDMVFPNTADYLVLTADLHTHSVFSDGHVWPNVRVEEGLRDGLDILAITEHLEWQPHRADLPNPDRNRAYAIAREAATDEPILVVPGVEITRELPTGHINAIFVENANPLVQVDAGADDAAGMAAGLDALPDWGSEREVIEYYVRTGLWAADAAASAANAQGAFLFWNHPSWSEQAPDGKPPVSPQHQRWFSEKLLHGIEVVNGVSYSPESFQLALDNDLALIGTSDVHDLIDWDYPPALGGHRPVTLVFAGSAEMAAVRAALFAKRTAVWFQDTLLGRQSELAPLVKASIVVTSAHYLPETTLVQVRLENRSSVPFQLKNLSDFGDQNNPGSVTLPALGALTLELATGVRLAEISWPVRVLNAYTTPNTQLVTTLSSPVTDAE